MNKRDMTQGPITKNLVLFMLPVVGSSIFQQLYNTADFMFVGNLLGKEDAAAVGASSSLITCILGLFLGLSIGTNVLGAQAVGAKNEKKLRSVLTTSMRSGLISGIILAIVGILLSETILLALNTPSEAMGGAVIYMRVYLISLPFMVIYNMGSAYMRALGDTTSPFKILVVSGFVNVGADALLVAVIPLGVFGVALATVISQALSVVLLLIFLKKRENDKSIFSTFGERINGEVLKEILKIGVPAGIQSIVITLSNVVVQYYINGLGTTSVAAFSVYYKLENFFYLPCLAFGQAAVTFTGQNKGAGTIHRLWKGNWINAGIGIIVVGGLAAIVMAIPNQVFRLFISDPTVISEAILIGMVTFPFYFIYVFVDVFGGGIRGLGHALYPMIASIATFCGVRIGLLIYISKTDYSLQRIATVYPITWAIVGTLFVAGFFVLYRRLHAEAHRHFSVSGWIKRKRYGMDKGILVVSFGTTVPSGFSTIEKAELKIKEAFPDRVFYRAFTSNFIRRKLKEKGEDILSLEEALDKALKEGIKDLIIQTTLITPGDEFDKIAAAAAKEKDCFEVIRIGNPLLYDEDDIRELKKLYIDQYGPFSRGKALLLVGHGSEHGEATRLYKEAKMIFGEDNPIYLGTIEGVPTLEDALESIRENGVKSVRVVPFLFLAGQHVKEDLAGDDETSVKSRLSNMGINVEVIPMALGEYESVIGHITKHAKEAVEFRG